MTEEIYSDEMSCLRCGRKLTTVLSHDRGYGPVCYKKHLREKEEEEFRKNQVTIEDVDADETRG